jgi:hypothetical protein
MFLSFFCRQLFSSAVYQGAFTGKYLMQSELSAQGRDPLLPLHIEEEHPAPLPLHDRR